MQVTFLGTGAATAAPLYGCTCPACSLAQAQPERRRGPASCLVQLGSEQFLIDAGMQDLKERFAPGTLEDILLTHYHMDHVQGLFGLRWGTNTKIRVTGPKDPNGCDDLFKHPGILDFSHTAEEYEGFKVGSVEVIPLTLNHSKPTVGYFCQSHRSTFAYLSDTSGLGSETYVFLRSVCPKVLVLDAAYPPQIERPRNHNDLIGALEIFDVLKPEKLYLTHLDHGLDQWLLEHPDALPRGVEVAWDGMTIQL